ncbi:MAG: ribulose-phosphate 3-epimerase [Lachnospiraceae bacterium]
MNTIKNKIQYKLAPSILSADFTRLGENLKDLDEAKAEYIHFDVMDGMFVPNISFGFPVLEAVRKATKTKLDVHLMVEKPMRYVEKFIKAGADIVTVHVEACEDIELFLDTVHSLGAKAGLAVKPGTSVDVVRPYLAKTDMVLVMTVEPGLGGQKYISYTTEKIASVRQMISEQGYDCDVEVDGGINDITIHTVLQAGANVIVSGSSVMLGDIQKNVQKFHQIMREYQLPTT